MGHYETINGCQIFETNLRSTNINKSENSRLSDVIEETELADDLYDPDDNLTTLKFELGEIQVGSQLNNSEKQILIDLLTEYKDVMSFDGRLGSTNLIEHEIDIQGHRPVHVPPYRVSPQQRVDIQKQAQLMLDLDVIEPSKSPWSSPILIVKKPQEKGGGFRFVNDFREVNKYTKNWVYQMPLISDYFRSLAGYSIFASLDANSGFWQIPVKLEDRDITSFIVPGFGTFRYKKMPMGAKTSAQTFQCLMDIVLGSLKYTVALTFLDDILVPGSTFMELIKNLTLVFDALRSAGLTLKPSKSVIGASSIRFLGHVIDRFGIHVDVRKIKAIAKMPPPNSQKTVRQFLGKCSYYNEYILNFAIIAAPLFELTKKGVEFIWSDIHQKAFDILKKKLSSPPILVHYNPELDTELRTDASTIGIGYRLVQLQSNNKWHTVSNGSRKLNNAEKKYPITELECLAVVCGLKKNRSYLVGLSFKIVTDHKALKALLNKKDLPPRLARWALVIAEFPEAEIVHRPGNQMEDVDLLSRLPVDKAPEDEEEFPFDDLIGVIKEPNQIVSYEDYKEEQTHDERIKPILDSINNGDNHSNTHLIINDLLYKIVNGKQLLELPESLINNILYMHHDHPYCGHHGFDKTYNRINNRFYFPNMRKIIKKYVESCKDCLTKKRPSGKPYGFMQTTQICRPTEKWFIDFLGPFPVSHSGDRYVLVCVDSFTRYLETKATKNSTAETIAEFLINQIITRHGLMKYLISDRAQAFLSRTINILSKRMGFAHITTTSFRPQSNKSERVNASITSMLSNYCSTDQKDWNLMLNSITLAINTQYHRSIRTTPYYLMYARNCILPGDIPSVIETENERINHWKTACELAKDYIKRTQNYNKSYYDKKRQDIKFKVGEKVMLYSPNRVLRKSNKLRHLYFGPYNIVAVKSPLVYELQIKPNQTDVVHVSRLKKYHERSVCPPKRSQLRNQTGILTMILLTILIILCIGNTQAFDGVNPIQWKVSERKIVDKVQPFNIKVDFKSQCEIFNESSLSLKDLFIWCKNMVEESFVEPFNNLCSTHQMNRHKRILPIIIGITCVVATGGVITAGYFTWQLRKVENKVTYLIEELNQINKQVLQGKEADKHIKNVLSLVGMELNRTELIAKATNKEINTDIALAAYLAYKFATIKLDIQSSVDSNGNLIITDKILNILNATLPCAEACPISHTSLMNCNIDAKNNKITLGIVSRELSNNLIILEADTFTLYNRSNIKNCFVSYSGPQYLIYDKSLDCAMPLPTFEELKYVQLAKHHLMCSANSFKDVNWNKIECSIENTFDDIQIKYGSTFNYIYCYENNITIKGRVFPCPDFPFKLKVDTSFSIKDFSYLFDTNSTQIENPVNYLWSTTINNFLYKTTINYSSNIEQIFDEIDKIKLDEITKWQNPTIVSTTIVSACGIVVTTLAIVYAVYRIKIYCRRRREFESFQRQIVAEAARLLVESLSQTRSQQNLRVPDLMIEQID